MDGIMTGEQVWRARPKRATGGGVEERMSIPRALLEADRAARERGARSPGLLRRAVKGWMRGWTAFVATMGNPYLSLAGHLPGAREEGAGRPEAGRQGGPEGRREEVERCA